MATIFALSSGAPPAGIGIIRISGPEAGAALAALAGSLPAARRATRRRLRGADGDLLDDALVLWFPGLETATGEDLAELHLHGGRAVIAAVEAALETMPGLRRADPGEFTRRAFANGQIDLAQAEGLADLLFAETELQRSAAMAAAGGHLSRRVEEWRDRLLMLSAQVEASLDFDDEDDVSSPPDGIGCELAGLEREIDSALAAPAAETLREGYRIALAGPPNAGKSTLFNALVEAEAAITAPMAGTTRDVLVRSVAIAGVPLSFVDMAGLRTDSRDPVEAIGVARAKAEIARADLVLWLGPEDEGPQGCWEIEAQAERTDHAVKRRPAFIVSAVTGEGLPALVSAMLDRARSAMPRPGEVAITARQRQYLARAREALESARCERDLLLLAEGLRQSRTAVDALLGRTSTEDVLDALFGRFCIGK